MICAIIPTYNNAGTLADVIERTAHYIRDIIVVVDGSTDNTRDVLQAITIPITVVDIPQNKGKGYALKTGFHKAIELGFTHALTIDSDGQHYPEDIPSLLEVSRQQPLCYVVGTRNIQAENMPGKSTFANKFSNFWFTVQTGVHLPDTQTGMRIYPLQRLHGLSFLTSRYEAELELLVFAAWAGEKLVPVDIRVYYPNPEERVSHFRPAYDFTRISILNTILCFVAVIYGLPRRWWRSALYGPWFLFAWIVSLIFVSFAMLFRASNQTYRTFFHWCAKILMHTFPASPFHVMQKEKALPQDIPAVHIANHTSVFDILAAVSVHKNLTIISQKWVFSNPFFAPIARGAGFVPVTAGYEELLDILRTEVAKGNSILIYPEGTRSKKGVISRFHRGAFFLAEQLHLPIQPMIIEGTFHVMSKGELFIGKANVQLSFLDPIYLDDGTWGNTYQEATRHIHQLYKEQLTHY